MAQNENADAANVGISESNHKVQTHCNTAEADGASESAEPAVQPIKSAAPQKGAMQGSDLGIADVEPWPEPVHGADVLNEIAETFSRYMALPDGAADALALWCAHSHSFNAFEFSPRLNISSPDKQCGKTTCRDLIAQFVPRALPTKN